MDFLIFPRKHLLCILGGMALAVSALGPVRAGMLLSAVPAGTLVPLSLGATASEPQGTVTGVVTDVDGQALAGVTIQVKGADQGTITDAEGRFTLEAPDNAVLVISYIGYETQEVSAGSGRPLAITLESSALGLDQVVVVGYGTQKKANLTGAVTSVSGAQLSKRPIGNSAAMLEGLMPGVRAVQGTGEPGNEGVSIRVRGTGTFSAAGSDPLVLIDGIEGNLTNINPNNIANISVLKDAASAAIYGARAANGVILVTTKKGQSGKMKISYEGNFSIQTPTKMFDLVTNSAQYMEMYNEARLNTGLTSGLYPQDVIDTYKNATDRKLYPNTDWLDLLFNPAPTQMHNLTFSGGRNGTTYNVSLGYMDQTGVMEGFDYKRYNARLSLTSEVNRHISFGGIIGLKQGEKSEPRTGSADIFLAAMAQGPDYAPQLPDGSGRYTASAYSWESPNKNPFLLIDKNIDLNTHDYLVSPQAWLEVKFLKGFTWYTKGAINFSLRKTDDFRPEIPGYNFHTGDFVKTLSTGGGGAGLTARDETNYYSNLYTYLTYAHGFASGHSLKGQVGYSMETNTWQYLSGYRKDFVNSELRQLDAGSPAVQNAGGTKQQWAIRSYFGRLNYDYKDRYLLEVNARYDGSSRLNADSRWGVFPSVSAGWRATEEKFMQELNWSWLNNLKLRASYGKLGNQNIGLYPYQALLALTGNYPFDDANLSTGVAQTALSNPEIKWEETTMADIGIDLTLFKGLTLTVDWYNKLTTDILRGAQVTGVVGLNPPTINDGEMRNRGIEFDLQYRHAVQSGALNGLAYNLGVNLSHNKNELVRFGAAEKSAFQIKEEGREWDAYYMLEWIGIFQSKEEIAASPKQYNDATVPGDLKFKDQNDDGVVNDEDRIPMSGMYPDLSYMFNLGATWKGFDFYLMFQGITGQKFYVRQWGTVPFIQGAPPTTNWLDRWTPSHPSKTMPLMYFGNNAPERISRYSSWYLQDASYLRMKTLSIGYTIPAVITEQVGISNLRIYVSGDNLLTVTKYPGLDPERATSGNFTVYPQNKVYAIGINITF